MIGQHITATLWSVTYAFKKPRTDTSETYVTGETLVLTADPTGDDLRQVVERMVMGAKPVASYTDFVLTMTRRINDVVGLAHLAATDRGWPAGLDIGAVVLEAGTRQQAAIGDLSKQLAVVRAEIAALRVENEGLYRIAKSAWATRTDSNPEHFGELDEALDFYVNTALPARLGRVAEPQREGPMS